MGGSSESWGIIRRVGPYAAGGMLTLGCVMFASISWRTANSKLFERAVQLAAKSDRVQAHIGEYRTHGLLWAASSVVHTTGNNRGAHSRFAHGAYSCRLMGSTGAANVSFSIRCMNASPCELESIEVE